MRSNIGHAEFETNPIRIAVLTALLTWHTLGATAEPAPAARYHVDQPSQPLSESLRAIAKLTSSSVLFDPGVVNGRMSHPVSGQLSGAEAISRALEGTGLASEVQKDGAIVVKPRGAPVAVPATPSVGVSSASEPRAVILLAQAAGGSSGDGNPPPSAVLVAANEQREQIAAEQRVEVTGTRIKRVETDGAIPVNVYTKEDIDKSGQPTLTGFLNGLNVVSLSSTSEGGLAGAAGGGVTTVQLRGLPIGHTLVLVNGRRLQDSGASGFSSFFNLSLIPLAAVERVEVLPTGSSAVYGGDALAGVVNIILKKSLDGFALDSRYGVAKGIEDGGLSLATGGMFERGSFLIVGALTKRTTLSVNEREFFRDGDYRRFGGPDLRGRGCTPGTVRSTTGANLPGLSAPLAGVPSVAPGHALTVSDFAATAGQPNLCYGIAQGYGVGLVWGSETATVHATTDYRISDTWSALSELTYSKARQLGQETGPFLGSALVAASNPFNPFGADVLVTARLSPENGTTGTKRDTDFTRALLGVRGEIAKGWEFEASVVSAVDKSQSLALNSIVNSAARTAALAATTPSGALNPFATGRAASDEVLRGIWSDDISNSRGSRDLLNAFVRGSAFDLPAGPVDLIAGIELGRDKWFSGGPTGSFDYSRRTTAQFAEARIPLLRSPQSNQTRARELAALTLAGRRDDYSDVGTANTYQVGLEVRPASTILLRAATATSFKPPSLYQQTPRQSVSRALDSFGLTDPLLVNAAITSGEVIIGAPRVLKPETGEAQTLGVLYEPDAVPGLRVGLNAWRIALKDQIISPASAQFFLDNEQLFPGSVERAPSVGGVPGLVTRVNYSLVNIGKVDVAGTDLELAYLLPTSVGKWNLSAGATRTSKYDVVLVPNSPTDDRLGRRNTEAWAPKWKGRLFAGLDRGSWTLGITGRYLGNYKDAGTSTRELGDIWHFDLVTTADLKKLAGIGTSFRSATLTAGIVNVGNKLPEFVGSFPFYDFTQGDWQGRYVNVRLSVAW
jgi:iron complex outermembrane recepter protein